MITYLLICAACDPGGQTPIPFDTAEERERHRAIHATAVGLDGNRHNAFTLYDMEIVRNGTSPHSQYEKHRQEGTS